MINDETRRKLSDKMKAAHKSGRHPGWRHINMDPNRMSYPEKFIKKVLINNKIYDKYTIIEHMPIGKYFLDFAIIDLKLDIEIDGCQHYRDANSIEHDNIRNDFLEKAGWKIYRICWTEFNCANTKDNINKLLSYIDTVNNNSSVYYDIGTVTLKKKYIPKYGNRKTYNIAVKQQTDDKERDNITKVLNANIDFSKFGWVKKVAEIVNKPPQKINGWMKRYLFDIYMTKCFKVKR